MLCRNCRYPWKRTKSSYGEIARVSIPFFKSTELLRNLPLSSTWHIRMKPDHLCDLCGEIFQTDWIVQWKMWGMGNLVSLLLYFLHQNILWFLELEVYWADRTNSCANVLGGDDELLWVLWCLPRVSTFSPMAEIRGWSLISISWQAAPCPSIAGLVLRIEQVWEVV